MASPAFMTSQVMTLFRQNMTGANDKHLRFNASPYTDKSSI